MLLKKKKKKKKKMANLPIGSGIISQDYIETMTINCYLKWKLISKLIKQEEI
jgi:hypothetical protein